MHHWLDEVTNAILLSQEERFMFATHALYTRVFQRLRFLRHHLLLTPHLSTSCPHFSQAPLITHPPTHLLPISQSTQLAFNSYKVFCCLVAIPATTSSYDPQPVVCFFLFFTTGCLLWPLWILLLSLQVLSSTTLSGESACDCYCLSLNPRVFPCEIYCTGKWTNQLNTRWLAAALELC